MKEEPKYKVGDLVNFSRYEKNKSEEVKIIAVETNKLKGFISIPTFYIIESKSGFTPSDVLVLKYKLDAKKKYIFVRESELNKI